jgi:type II secretory pathway component GspD/PulD (secretin)
VLRLARLTKKFLCFSLVLSLPIFLPSCSGGRIDPFDLDTGTTREEAFDTILKNRDNEKKSNKASENKSPKETPIPKLSKLIVSPPPPVIGGDKVISFSVTDQVPLKDVLIEFGRMVKIDVDIDPAISGGIILNAKNRPLKEVIDRIATLGNLRYSYNNGVLRFENDNPYTKNYFVDYLAGGNVWTDVEANLTAILGSSNSSSTKAESDGSSFTPNKSAGIIAVYATDKQHQKVAQYLADVDKYASAQVLIEAKVIEVNLTKEYSAGIDWTKASTLLSTSSNSLTSGGAKLVITTGELAASIAALEKFGTTKTISSPRISAINNQKATLNFTDKLVYFKVEQTQSNTSSTGSATSLVATTITSTKLEESVGVILEIVPSINLKTGEITMSVKPKLSVLNSWVSDPASPQDLKDADGARYVNQVPIIQSREIETSAKVQSGNILVIGGLMKDQSTSSDSGLPILGRIPILGWLFKSMSRSSDVTETVIFIKATIINSGTPANKVDRDIQKNFDPNKRKYF